MKKQILNLGKALNKTEQKSINGGAGNLIPIPSCDNLGYSYTGQKCRTYLHCTGTEDTLCFQGCCIII